MKEVVCTKRLRPSFPNRWTSDEVCHLYTHTHTHSCLAPTKFFIPAVFETDGEADDRMLGPPPRLPPHGSQSEKNTGQDVRITGHQAVNGAHGGINNQTRSGPCHEGHQTENLISLSNVCHDSGGWQKTKSPVLTASEKRVITLKLRSCSHTPKPLWESWIRHTVELRPVSEYHAAAFCESFNLWTKVWQKGWMRCNKSVSAAWRLPSKHHHSHYCL